MISYINIEKQVRLKKGRGFMRKKWFVGIFLSLISMTCISGCGVSYKDYTDIQQTETETEQTGGIETNREYIMEEDVMKLPSDAVIIDDYSKEGTILTSPHLNYNISIKVNKAILADNMDAYKEIGGTDSNFIEWIKKVNSREAGFTNTYNEADGTFDSRYDGIGTKIFMIKPYSLDRENGEITRLSICESIFYDYAESTGADYGNMTLKAGEHRNIVLCMVEPDKIVKKYYRNENGRNVATDTDDINYDNIYLRLSLLGVQQVANGENFIKFNIE